MRFTRKFCVTAKLRAGHTPPLQTISQFFLDFFAISY